MSCFDFIGVEKIREGLKGLEEGKQLNFYLILGPKFSRGIRTETLVRVDNNHMAISSPLLTGQSSPTVIPRTATV
jgi:hypothetical protein